MLPSAQPAIMYLAPGLWSFTCMQQVKHTVPLQVRNAQLDKEAGELRLENAMLSESADLHRVAVANSEEVFSNLVGDAKRG